MTAERKIGKEVSRMKHGSMDETNGEGGQGVEAIPRRDGLAIYVRSVTGMQDGNPIADQLRICTEYAMSMKLPINSFHVYCDAALSGSNLQRPGMAAMLADIRAEKAGLGHLVVTDLNRISRNTFDLLAILREMQRHGIVVHFAKDMTTTQEGLPPWLTLPDPVNVAARRRTLKSSRHRK